MIKTLNHSTESIAIQIFDVFQKSYQIEAELIGVDDFPPLKRSAEDISHSATQFYGCFVNESLAAVVEVEIDKISSDEGRLKICSLTVDPSHFRKGIAGQLIEFVFSLNDILEYEVETAVVNEPAIKLYKKHGFVEFKRYIPAHGIPKVIMRKV